MGPLQLSLARMVWDVMKMLIIIVLIIFAFASALSRMYVYYRDAVRILKDGDIEEQLNAFAG